MDRKIELLEVTFDNTPGMGKKLDRFVRGVALAPLAPLTGLLGFWWISFGFLPKSWIACLSIAGLLTGFIADLCFLKKLLDQKLSKVLWGTVFLFYSVCGFGFFMGVPVFNVALTIPAGIIVGGRLFAERADRQLMRKTALSTAWFTTSVLALICAASAFIALVSASTANDLRGMLGLNFEVTLGMLLGLILVGGSLLLVIGWCFSVMSVRITYSFLNRKT